MMIKIMDKYAKLKMFHHDRWLQAYMYTFVYVDPKAIPVGGYFRLTKKLLRSTRKYQLQYQPENICSDLVTYFHKNIS